MLLSGTLQDWSIGFNGLPLKAKIYLGATSLTDLHSATHVADAYTCASKASGLFGLGFVDLKPLPLVPHMIKIASNEDADRFVDADFMAMLFDGACIGQRSSASTIVTFDLQYSETVHVISMAPQPHPDFETIAPISFKYEVNGITINGATYAAYDTTSKIRTPIGLDTDKVRVTMTTSGNVSITTVRDLLPEITTMCSTPVPDYGLVLHAPTSTACYVSGLALDTDGALLSIDVFASEL